jgi:hypothetical protein
MPRHHILRHSWLGGSARLLSHAVRHAGIPHIFSQVFFSNLLCVLAWVCLHLLSFILMHASLTFFQASTIDIPVKCIGTDGSEYSHEVYGCVSVRLKLAHDTHALHFTQMCANKSRPAPLECPATMSCVTHGWEALPVTCPTNCGKQVGAIREPAPA